MRVTFTRPWLLFSVALLRRRIQPAARRMRVVGRMGGIDRQQLLGRIGLGGGHQRPQRAVQESALGRRVRLGGHHAVKGDRAEDPVSRRQCPPGTRPIAPGGPVALGHGCGSCGCRGRSHRGRPTAGDRFRQASRCTRPASRAAATSGRSCSLACSVFFGGRAGRGGRWQPLRPEKVEAARCARPPSWSDPDDGPAEGDRCGACAGRRWWLEAEALIMRWRCATCHPSAAAGVVAVAT